GPSERESSGPDHGEQPANGRPSMAHGSSRRHAPWLGGVTALMLAGFITGGLARLAVPGPDPMPIWLTIAIGLAGSWGGGAVAAAIWGWDSTTGVSIFGFV